ncbi:CU044_5270 family protein [Cryobacterium frigoriphilum]|nr:CU044_5270 family protein [Cryobacterium frigoriphilum]
MHQNIMEQITADKASAASIRTRPVVIRRRRIAFASVGAVAAAAVILAGVIIPSGNGSSAEAATILNDAAALTITSSDLVAAPGEYLKIATEAAYATVGRSGDGEPVTWISPSTITVYKPGDPDADWVMERHDLAPTEFFGDGAEASALANWAVMPNDPLTNGIFRAQDAAFYGAPDPARSTDALPRDPQELYEYIRSEYNGGSNNPDEDAWVRITALLRTGTAPADLRSALYRAAALVPGIEAIPGQATLNGRTGIALGRIESSRDERQDIIIDPETGELIGERTVRTKAGFGAPAGTIWAATAVTTTVVDTTP